MKKLARFSLTVVVATLAAACDGNTGAEPDPVFDMVNATVTASTTFTFTPSVVSVSTGGQVTWIFQALEHNVTFTTANGAPANIVNSVDTAVARSFETAGVYSYHCTIHPQMTGTVRVGQ